MKRKRTSGAPESIPPGMRAALRAARRGEGRVSPNPRVGAALLLRTGELITAHHARFGGPHAEARLLDRVAPSRPLPRGAVLYVTLEPCCHHGKTPPCVERIVAARPSRVVVAMADPYPKVRGKGIEQIRRAGLPVEVGVGATAAVAGNLAFHLRYRLGRAALRLKLATSLDARLGRDHGGDRWITSPEARSHVQRERASCDAVLIGSNTVLVDRPRLTVREGRGPEPSRIVVDSGLRIPVRGSVWRAWAAAWSEGAARRSPSARDAGRVGNYEERQSGKGLRWDRRPRLVLATITGSGRKLERFAQAGWEVWQLPAQGGRVPLSALLARAAEEGFLQVLAEAGPTLAGALLDHDLVDEISLYVAPAVLGGRQVWPEVGGLRDRGEIRFEHTAQRRVGDDLWLGLRRRGLVERLLT